MGSPSDKELVDAAIRVLRVSTRGMKARELAAEINALELGFSIDKSALNSALHRSRTSDLQKNESWEWELKPAAASGVARKTPVKQAPSARQAPSSAPPTPPCR